MVTYVRKFSKPELTVSPAVGRDEYAHGCTYLNIVRTLPNSDWTVWLAAGSKDFLMLQLVDGNRLANTVASTFQCMFSG